MSVQKRSLPCASGRGTIFDGGGVVAFFEAKSHVRKSAKGFTPDDRRHGSGQVGGPSLTVEGVNSLGEGAKLENGFLISTKSIPTITHKKAIKTIRKTKNGDRARKICAVPFL